MKKMVLLGILSLFSLTGCNTLGAGLYVDTSYSYTAPITPPHASAYVKPQQYRYYYYPRAEFYFDTGRNMYFYLNSGSQWAHSPTLPLRLRPHLSSGYVELEMNDARPYRRHDFYRNKYRNYRSKPEHDRRYKRSPGHDRNRLSDDRQQYRNNRDANKHQYRDNKLKNRQQYRDNVNANKYQYRDNKNAKKHQYRDDEDDKYRSNGLRDNRKKH